MSKQTYIKVTPKGEKKAVVVTATNEAFYKSQGAKIEEPTQEEILAAFPEENPKSAKSAKSESVIPVEETEEYKALQAQHETSITDLQKAHETELATLKANYEDQIEKLTAQIPKK